MAGIQIYCYADDMAIIGDTRNFLEKAIEEIDEWCLINDMGLNKDKSHILWIPWKTKGKKGERIFERGKTIRGITIVPEAKYLGVLIDDKLLFTG